jgi:hypothetical protein
MALYDLERLALTYDRLLQYVTEYEVFAYYLGYNFKVGRVFASPFREDTHPSFSIFRSKENSLMFKDFATSESGNCIDFVQNVFNIAWSRALEKVYEDLVDGRNKKEIIKIEKQPRHESKTKIAIKRRYFNDNDDLYWSQYGITREILKEHNTYPISFYWINDNPIWYKYNLGDPAYASGVFDKFKIYRPTTKNKKDKFISNCTAYDLFGWEQLPEHGDLVIITKSLKDMLVLKLNGYNSVATQGEGHSIPKEIITELRNRFDRIAVLYDRDNAGVNSTKKLVHKHNFDFAFIPKKYKCKDISDLRKAYGAEETKEVLNKIFKFKEDIYREQKSEECKNNNS